MSSQTHTRPHEELNPNEYRILYKNGCEEFFHAVNYELKNGKATIQYWIKNPFRILQGERKYMLRTFTRIEVESVYLVVNGDVR